MDNKKLLKISAVLFVLELLAYGILLAIITTTGVKMNLTSVLLVIVTAVFCTFIVCGFPFGWAYTNTDKLREALKVVLDFPVVGWVFYLVVKVIIAAYSGWLFFIKAILSRNKS